MKLPIPSRNQPLDVTFISDIVQAINDLYDKVVLKISAYASIWTATGRKQVRSTELKFVTGQVIVTTGSDVSAGTTKSFEYRFDTAFQVVPVVTATVIAVGSSATDADKDAQVILTDISTSVIKGIVRFDTKGKSTVSVNMIAVGIAN